MTKERKLIEILERIHITWILDNILYKGEWCINIPRHVGKTKDEIKNLYPEFNYWPVEEQEYKCLPPFAGIALTATRIYIYSFSKEKICMDAFYIILDDMLYESFSDNLLLMALMVINELENMGYTPETASHLNGLFTFVSNEIN